MEQDVEMTFLASKTRYMEFEDEGNSYCSGRSKREILIDRGDFEDVDVRIWGTCQG